MIEYKQITFHEALVMLENDEPLWVETKLIHGICELVNVENCSSMGLKHWSKQNYFKRIETKEGNENE